MELRPSSPPAVKIVCYIYRLSVGDKAWQTVTPSVTQHRMSSVFWRGIVGQHKSFFFLFFFSFLFFFDTWISALSTERGCGFNWTMVCFVAFAEGIFVLCLRAKTLMRLKAHTKIPKKQLRDYNKDKNVSKKKYAIFKISKFCYFYRDFPLSSNRALYFIWLPKFSSVPARLRRMLKDLLTYSSPN